MSENQGPRPTTVPALHPDTQAPSKPEDAGGQEPSFVLIGRRIITVHLEDKGTLLRGWNAFRGVWKDPSMISGFLAVGVEGVNHDVFFVTILGKDPDPTYCLAEGLELNEGSDLDVWLARQVDQLWAVVDELTSEMAVSNAAPGPEAEADQQTLELAAAPRQRPGGR
jgi:hypothetical protein